MAIRIASMIGAGPFQKRQLQDDARRTEFLPLGLYRVYCDMNWLGLRNAHAGTFNPAGLGQTPFGPVSQDDILATGSLLLDCAITPSLTSQTLLSYQSCDPWPVALRIDLDPRGVLTLTQQQGDAVRRHTLPTGFMERAAIVTIVFAWDAPQRSALLSLEVPDTGALFYTALKSPLPLSMPDAARLTTDRQRCRMMHTAGFVAVASGIMPIGPLPSLAPDTPVRTPRGPVAVSQLRPGQIVSTSDGDTAQVRWAGGLTVPALARFAPLRIRAPFYQAQRDIRCAPCQQVRFRNTEVEYLFATHTASARAGDLLAGVGPDPAHYGPVATYAQVLLDRPAALDVHGVACDTLDVETIINDPAILRHSVLRDLPRELMPASKIRDVRRLQSYETRSLCELRTA